MTFLLPFLYIFFIKFKQELSWAHVLLKQTKSIISLDLCANTIGYEGAFELAQSLAENSTLLSFNLSTFLGAFHRWRESWNQIK